MKIYCCGCEKEVDARLTDGSEIYPHRPDLYKLSFYICDACENYVGCHKKSTDKKPLGCIPTSEIRDARMKIHSVLDPLWKHKKFTRNSLYKAISKHIGWEYHTANIRTLEEAEKIYQFVETLSNRECI